MTDDELTRQRLSSRLYLLSDADIKKLEYLIENHADIDELLKRRSAAHVFFKFAEGFGVWIAVVIGGFTIGLDAIKSFILGLIGQ